MDCRLLLMTGGDYPIPECQLTLHQPTIAEIAMLGEEDFFIGIQLLTIDKEKLSTDNSVPSDIDNFQIFMTIINQKEMADKKQIIQQVLMLILPNFKVSFTPQSLLVSSTDGVKILDKNNFSYFQEAIKEIFCLKDINKDTYNPSNDKAKEIAEKLMRGRQKAAAEKGENNGSIFVQYLSILAIGLHIPITNLINYTVFMVYDQIQRFELFIEYDLDIRSRLAGATPQSEPENWMKNMY